jgi:hypothetical protein
MKIIDFGISRSKEQGRLFPAPHKTLCGAYRGDRAKAVDTWRGCGHGMGKGEGGLFQAFERGGKALVEAAAC